MNSAKKRGMKYLLAGLLLTAVLLVPGAKKGALAEAEPPRETAEPAVELLELPVSENGTLVTIPIEQEMRKTVGEMPEEDGYLYENGAENPTGYADPSITVHLGTGRIYDTNYIYARIKIADASQMRTLMNAPVSSNDTNYVSTLAKRVQAVIAINGDFYGGEDVTRGALMRQGKMLRLRCDGKTDVLVVDRAGDFHILKNAEDADVEALQDQAVNIFTFGPALVVDGVAQSVGDDNRHGAQKPAQRMAYCQTGPLEYLLITSEGPQNAGSTGLNMEQFVDLVSSMPGVRNAYNLDGGSSATMVFRMDGKNWQKINALSNPKIRPVKDMIYFISGWMEQE